jgi:hypothetical protein
MRNVRREGGVIQADAALRPLSSTVTPMVRSAIALFSCILAASACDAVTGGQSGNPIGVGTVSARTKGTGYTTGPVIAFYRVNSATFVSASPARDSCYQTSWSEPASTQNTSAPKLTAGTTVTIQIGSRIDTLTKAATGADQSYKSTLSSGIPYTPGDSMVVTMSGDVNGFPISTFRGKTAEAFVMNTPGLPNGSGPITLSWTPSQDANSIMLVNLRFIAGTTATSFNRQIACTFIDDGAGTVPASVTTDWLAATTRDVISQRIRTILGSVDVPLSYFNIVSSFSWPTPASP